MMVSRKLVAILPTFDEIKLETSWKRPAIVTKYILLVATMVASTVSYIVASMVAFIVFKLDRERERKWIYSIL